MISRHILSVLALAAVLTASPLLVGCTALETTITPQKTGYVTSTALAHTSELSLLGSVSNHGGNL